MLTPNKKVDECIKSGKKGKRHYGLIKTTPNREKAMAHLKKAILNFNALTYFAKGGYSFWSPSAAFYCVYHCCLAILAKYGYESRSQKCTFYVIELLIGQGKLKTIVKEDLEEIYDPSESLETSENLLDIREDMQYGTGTIYETEEFKKLLDRTKKLPDNFRLEIER